MGYVFYEDPGHGWLKVTRKELKELGIADKISPYSYQSRAGNMVYLEEDQDMTTFLVAKRLGQNLPNTASMRDILRDVENIYHEDNRIRGLRSYRP